MCMEVFCDVDDYVGLYSVSNLGRVLSHQYSGFPRLLVLNKTNDGYLSVTLNKSGYSRSVRVHRLVAMTFLKSHDTTLQVNHIDGNKLNNNLCNLEFVTPKENTLHAITAGLRNSDYCKKSVVRVDLFKNLDVTYYESHRSACKETPNSTCSSICNAVNRKTKRHLHYLWFNECDFTQDVLVERLRDIKILVRSNKPFGEISEQFFSTNRACEKHKLAKNSFVGIGKNCLEINGDYWYFKNFDNDLKKMKREVFYHE